VVALGPVAIFMHIQDKNEFNITMYNKYTKLREELENQDKYFLMLLSKYGVL